jgi:hypothetical protein
VEGSPTGLLPVLLLVAQQAGVVSPPPATVPEAVAWMERAARETIRAAERRMDDGTPAFPPQVGTGYEAFWLRDFAYTLEGACEAYSDEELIGACRLFVRSVSADGAGVDCVRFDGTPVRRPGYDTMGENPVTDGGPFTVAVAWHTWRRTRDPALLAEVLDPLVRTLEAVPRNPLTGLVHITPGASWERCPYGFTDTVRKQGDLLFSSLLLVEAQRRLAELHRAADRANEAARHDDDAAAVAAAVRATFWDPELGLFRAATARCREPDLWGSAFAVYLDVADDEQSLAVARTFARQHPGIVQRGQLRHLPAGVTWEQACAPGTYQNGGYWATPIGWYVFTLDLVDPALADRTVLELVAAFQGDGICEWVNGDVHQLPGYLASVALPLAGIRAMLARRAGR